MFGGKKIPYPLCFCNVLMLNYCIAFYFVLMGVWHISAFPSRLEVLREQGLHFHLSCTAPGSQQRYWHRVQCMVRSLSSKAKLPLCASQVHYFFSEDPGKTAYPLYPSVFLSVKWGLIIVHTP